MKTEILYTRHEDGGAGWAEITLNRPEKGNALNRGMVGRLGELAEEIAADGAVRVVVLRGRGRFFSTGGDIAAWGALTPEEMRRDWILPGIDAFERIAGLRQPVIAAINGHALGGGLELALAADLRVAVRQAKFGAPEVTLGMITGWGGVRHLAEAVGAARAAEMTLVGAPVTAETALQWGLVNAVVDDEGAMERQVGEWVSKLCANGPIAMKLTKRLLGTMRADLRHQHAEAAAQALATEDCQEGVRAFREKRKPVFGNR